MITPWRGVRGTARASSPAAARCSPAASSTCPVTGPQNGIVIAPARRRASAVGRTVTATVVAQRSTHWCRSDAAGGCYERFGAVSSTTVVAVSPSTVAAPARPASWCDRGEQRAVRSTGDRAQLDVVGSLELEAGDRFGQTQLCAEQRHRRRGLTHTAGDADLVDGSSGERVPSARMPSSGSARGSWSRPWPSVHEWVVVVPPLGQRVALPRHVPANCPAGSCHRRAAETGDRPPVRDRCRLPRHREGDRLVRSSEDDAVVLVPLAVPDGIVDRIHERVPWAEEPYCEVDQRRDVGGRERLGGSHRASGRSPPRGRRRTARSTVRRAAAAPPGDDRRSHGRARRWSRRDP